MLTSIDQLFAFVDELEDDPEKQLVIYDFTSNREKKRNYKVACLKCKFALWY